MKHQQVKRTRHRKSRDERRSEDLDTLLQRTTPEFSSFYIEEPRLVFGGGQTAVDPKGGISSFGPIGTNPLLTKDIHLGIVGTGGGIQTAQRYLEQTLEKVRPGLNSRGKHYDSLCFPDFPGAKPGVGFRSQFSILITRDIPLQSFESAVTGSFVNEKLRRVVELVAKQIEMIKAVEPTPDVILVVLPKCVENELAGIGNPAGHRRVPLTGVEKIQKSFARETSRTGQQILDFGFVESEPQTNVGYWNLHHALKARVMAHGIPTQQVWESTLTGEGRTQDDATMAWNFYTALYYKANNIPWQLECVPQNTCFVGVSFFRKNPADSVLHTSLAQAFSGSGEGLVLQGPKAIIDRDRDPAPHLGEKEAEELLRGAVQLYSDFHDGISPHRVVIHKTSRYWPEELRGFTAAITNVPRHDFLSLERIGHRFMRTGRAPAVRGSVISLTSTHHVLYTVGYVPALRAYPGMRVPLPLEIVEHYGDSSAQTVCSEIVALTKVNWNSCSFACTEPITLQFSRTVGRILRELPKGTNPERLYKFYM
jgi:hypothetical protein